MVDYNIKCFYCKRAKPKQEITYLNKKRVCKDRDDCVKHQNK